MWWLMQQTQIILHIRAIWFSLFSLRNPDHVKKHKFYYIENTNFTTFSSHFFVFSLRNPDHVRNTNYTTSKTQIILHFRVTFFFFSPKPWSREKTQIILHRKHKLYYILMARKCSIICVCCISHHMIKSSFKYFL